MMSNTIDLLVNFTPLIPPPFKGGRTVPEGALPLKLPLINNLGLPYCACLASLWCIIKMN